MMAPAALAEDRLVQIASDPGAMAELRASVGAARDAATAYRRAVASIEAAYRTHTADLPEDAAEPFLAVFDGPSGLGFAAALLGRAAGAFAPLADLSGHGDTTDGEVKELRGDWLTGPLAAPRAAGAAGRVVGPRWPFDPVLAIVGPGTAGELALRFGVTRRTIQRWRLAGIPHGAADDVALTVGRHPAELWDGW